jgi:hypothetical protein
MGWLQLCANVLGACRMLKSLVDEFHRAKSIEGEPTNLANRKHGGRVTTEGIVGIVITGWNFEKKGGGGGFGNLHVSPSAAARWQPGERRMWRHRVLV